MIKVHSFCFNPFQENTYILYDETKNCVIIDPGCSNGLENEELESFIVQNNLSPVKLLNTHCHIDHVLGNAFVCKTFGLKPETHLMEKPVFDSSVNVASLYGLNYDESPEPDYVLEEGKNVKFGNTELEVIFAPGHSPGHVVFLNRKEKFLIGGDVLFYGSIGRTDLPGGDHNTLIRSIKEKLFVLEDNIVVHPGHGPQTNIGFEKKHNPFLT